jgi:hypothetical protein
MQIRTEPEQGSLARNRLLVTVAERSNREERSLLRGFYARKRVELA